jgi:rubrerythrin
MEDIFAGKEIVELGIQIEKNGRDFYNTLLKQSQDLKIQELFQFLATEEEKHIKAFQKILERTTKYEVQGLDSDDYFAYMNALASEHVFTKANTGALVAKSIKSSKEAIDRAIGFEKDSIIFYEGMKRVVPDDDRKTVDALIIQEQDHLRRLTRMKHADGPAT